MVCIFVSSEWREYLKLSLTTNSHISKWPNYFLFYAKGVNFATNLNLAMIVLQWLVQPYNTMNGSVNETLFRGNTTTTQPNEIYAET